MYNSVIGYSTLGTTILGEAIIVVSLNTNIAVTADTTFDFVVTTSNYGTVSFSMTVLNGDTTIQSPANEYSLGLGSTPSIVDNCISNCDQPVSYETYDCLGAWPYCYTVSSNLTYVDGCNGYINQVEVWTFNLYDQYGNPYIAPENLSFVVTYDYQTFDDCPGCNVSGTDSATIPVYVGNSSGSWTFYPLTYNYCAVSSLCNGTCYSTQSNFNVSATPYNIEVCTVFTTPTPTPTETPAATPFVGSVTYGADANDACNNPIGSMSMVGNNTTFCSSTVFTATPWNSVATGNYVIQYGSNTLNVSHTFSTNYATVYGGGCQPCVALPTPTPTSSVTPVYFANTVNYGSNASDACNNPTGTIGVGGNGSTFCNSTTFTSGAFASLPSGNYVLEFGGNTLNVSTTFGNPIAIVFGGGCQACIAGPTPSQTPSQTPTNTPTPTSPLVYYQILDCNDSSTAYSIGYPAGTFSINERCTAVNVVTRTVIVIGSTTTLPGGLLYTLTSQGGTGCVSPTPTSTETPPPTPSQTQSPGASPSPTTTLTATPTTTTTLTATQTQTPSTTTTLTATPTTTPTLTATPTTTPTLTATPTTTPTLTATPTTTNTATPTQTPSPTPTLGYIVQMVDCSNNTNIFRFNDSTIPSTTGVTYYITNSTEFTGCATVVQNTGQGSLYNGVGVYFTATAGGCGDSVCPRSSNKAAELYKCSDGSIFYANVEGDTAFPGAAYLYNGDCYSFVEFSGPGGPDLGTPQFDSCEKCQPTPTPTNTQHATPTPTPTVSVTPSACTYTSFCFYTTLQSLSGYNGNYESTGLNYNSRLYYSGDGTTTGYIYHTGTFWCLSNSLGGTCLLQGATPCYENCPDISTNDYIGGICPTPTPTGVNCSIFDFGAYFDCDWEPIPTPTPSVPCSDEDFTLLSYGVTPTPTPTGDHCVGKGMSFSMSGYTPAVTPTVTLTPSVTLTRTVDVAGQVSYVMLDQTFSCTSVKVLVNCFSGEEIYVNDRLVYNEIEIIIGMSMLAVINGNYTCVTYTRDSESISSNAIVDQIIQIYSDCAYCSIIPTPTPTPTITSTTTSTPTPTATPTQTQTATVTPSQTASNTPTPSQTATVGTTPPPTPDNTPTQTPTQTQTPSQTPTYTPTTTLTSTPTPTPNWVYVYQSCSPINGLITQIIQTLPVSFITLGGNVFKDYYGRCWSYVGQYSLDYIAPAGINPITYYGDYFTNAPTAVYLDCNNCELVLPNPIVESFGDNVFTAGECYNQPNSYEETHFPSASFTQPSLVNGIARFNYSNGTTSDVPFYIGDLTVSDGSFTCGCSNDCYYVTSVTII
jgi:hypothetical protein